MLSFSSNELEDGLLGGGGDAAAARDANSSGGSSDVHDALSLDGGDGPTHPQPLDLDGILGGGGGDGRSSTPRAADAAAGSGGGTGGAADAAGDIDRDSNRSDASTNSHSTVWSETSEMEGESPQHAHHHVPYSPAFTLLEETALGGVSRPHGHQHHRSSRTRCTTASFNSRGTRTSARASARTRGVSGRSLFADDEADDADNVRRCDTSCTPPCSPRSPRSPRRGKASTVRGGRRAVHGIGRGGGGGGGGGVDRCCFGVSLALNVALSVAAAMCAVLYVNLLKAATPVDPKPAPPQPVCGGADGPDVLNATTRASGPLAAEVFLYVQGGNASSQHPILRQAEGDVLKHQTDAKRFSVTACWANHSYEERAIAPSNLLLDDWWTQTGLTPVYSGRDTNATLLELLPGVPYRLRLELWQHVGGGGGGNDSAPSLPAPTVVDANFTVADSWNCGNLDDLQRFRDNRNVSEAMLSCAELHGFYDAVEIGECMTGRTQVSSHCGGCYALEAENTVRFCKPDCIAVGTASKAGSPLCSRCRAANSAEHFARCSGVPKWALPTYLLPY